MFPALYVPMLLFEPARGCWYLSFCSDEPADTQSRQYQPRDLSALIFKVRKRRKAQANS